MWHITGLVLELEGNFNPSLGKLTQYTEDFAFPGRNPGAVTNLLVSWAQRQLCACAGVEGRAIQARGANAEGDHPGVLKSSPSSPSRCMLGKVAQAHKAGQGRLVGAGVAYFKLLMRVWGSCLVWRAGRVVI